MLPRLDQAESTHDRYWPMSAFTTDLPRKNLATETRRQNIDQEQRACISIGTVAAQAAVCFFAVTALGKPHEPDTKAGPQSVLRSI